MLDQQWAIGDRVYDDTYKRYGAIIDVDDSYHSEVVVIFVRWGGGGVSGFTPDRQTRKVTQPCTPTD